MKRCSSCKLIQDDKVFLKSDSKNSYRTCGTCRDKKRHNYQKKKYLGLLKDSKSIYSEDESSDDSNSSPIVERRRIPRNCTKTTKDGPYTPIKNENSSAETVPKYARGRSCSKVSTDPPQVTMDTIIREFIPCSKWIVDNRSMTERGLYEMAHLVYHNAALQLEAYFEKRSRLEYHPRKSSSMRTPVIVPCDVNSEFSIASRNPNSPVSVQVCPKFLCEPLL